MKTESSYQDSPCIRYESTKDDEIDLIEILRILWERRWLILSVTFGITILVAIYTLVTPKVYKTSLTMTPATIDENGSAFSAMKNAGIKGCVLTSQEVWGIVVDTIKDKKVQAQFWENHISYRKAGADSDEITKISKKMFFKGLSIQQAGKKKNKVIITLSGNKSGYVTETLSSFVAYVNDYCRVKIMSELKQKIESERLAIDAEIEYKQVVERRENGHMLAELKKKKEVEEKVQRLKVQRRVRYLQEQKILAETLGIVEMSNNVQGKPLYALGTKALLAEIGMLNKEIADNKISSELLDRIQFEMQELENWDTIDVPPKEQGRLYWLNKIDLNQLSMNVFQSSNVSILQQVPQSNPKLIVPLGILLGLILGVFAAFIDKFITNFKKNNMNLNS